MEISELLIACADIGSVRTGRFGWASRNVDGNVHSGSDPEGLAQAVAHAIAAGHKVALGFECPLFVPVPRDPAGLTSARRGEGNRAWSAGAGAGALATGLAEVTWILRRIRELRPECVGFVDWRRFRDAETGVLFWEAFVSGGAKGASHSADASIAVNAFAERTASDNPISDVSCDLPLSVLGAAMLATGWSADLGLLSQPCLVVRAGAS